MQLSLTVLENRVQQEIEARTLQGYDMDGLADRLSGASGDRAALLSLLDELYARPLQSDWPYDEPSDLEDIRQARGSAPDLPEFYLAEGEIRNKIHGAWLGRAAGCILGKPLEMGFRMAEIEDYLRGANALPLDDFVPAQSLSSVRTLRRDCVPSMRGYVQYAQEDDDLNYMCLAVKLMETKGLDFTSLDVGVNWLDSIPFLWTWGPEHAVYLNLAVAIGEHDPAGVELEAVTGWLNPGTEWIGAQIRTDVYGYVCPHLPERAAEFAWRDAYLSHRKSGIYGAMWVAAMNAAAFTLLDMTTVIEAGLAQVPANSRFVEAIRRTMDWCEQDKDWRITGKRIREEYDKYGFAGTINNACCVAAALLYGWQDGRSSPAEIYERTITTAVQLAYDTDCNAATAGSVVGLMLGAHALPGKWIDPLNDTMRTCVVGFGQVSIEETARRSYELSRIVRSQIE